MAAQSTGADQTSLRGVELVEICIPTLQSIVSHELLRQGTSRDGNVPWLSLKQLLRLQGEHGEWQPVFSEE